MMNKAIYLTICLAALLFQNIPVHAKTGYVSDQLYITMRTGKSQRHSIIKTLKTDTPMEILEDSDDKYLKVKTTDEKTGYVLKQYITRKTPKYMTINRLKKEKEAAWQEVKDLKADLDKLKTTLSSRRGKYQSELTALNENAKDLKKQLTTSRNNLEELQKKYNDLRRDSGNLEDIISERNNLRKETSLLNQRIAGLETRNRELNNLKMLKWFLAGGGVFLIGWLIGRIPGRKKIKW